MGQTLLDYNQRCWSYGSNRQAHSSLRYVPSVLGWKIINKNNSKTLKSSRNSSFLSSERCSINISFLRNSFKPSHVKIFIHRVFISTLLFESTGSLKIFHCSFSHCFRRNKACLE